MQDKLQNEVIKRLEILERQVKVIGDLPDFLCEACGSTLPDIDGAHRCSNAYGLELSDEHDYVCRFCKQPVAFWETYKHWGKTCLNN